MNRFSREQHKIGIYAKTTSVEFQVPFLAHTRHESLSKEKKIKRFISNTMILFLFNNYYYSYQQLKHS